MMWILFSILVRSAYFCVTGVICFYFSNYSSKRFALVAAEILESRENEQNAYSITLALDHIREIGMDALSSYEMDQLASARKLKRVLRIYRSAASNTSPVVGDLLNVAGELLKWIQLQSSSPCDPEGKTLLQLLRFLAEEATPSDVLEATQAWTSSTEMDAKIEILPILQMLLRRGATTQSRGFELSGALFRLRRARVGLQSGVDESGQETGSAQQDKDQQLEPNIWKRMSSGMVAVLK